MRWPGKGPREVAQRRRWSKERGSGKRESQEREGCPKEEVAQGRRAMGGGPEVQGSGGSGKEKEWGESCPGEEMVQGRWLGVGGRRARRGDGPVEVVQCRRCPREGCPGEEGQESRNMRARDR